jgi:hypothetical protein
MTRVFRQKAKVWGKMSRLEKTENPLTGFDTVIADIKIA